jgi:hypothetical protein
MRIPFKKCVFVAVTLLYSFPYFSNVSIKLCYKIVTDILQNYYINITIILHVMTSLHLNLLYVHNILYITLYYPQHFVYSHYLILSTLFEHHKYMVSYLKLFLCLSIQLLSMSLYFQLFLSHSAELTSRMYN